MPNWLQALGAIAAVAMIAAALAFAWGQLSGTVQGDHAILVEIRDDVDQIRIKLHDMEIREARILGRIEHLEKSANGLGDYE